MDLRVTGEGVVGRETRRAAEIDFYFDGPAPVLSRFVGRFCRHVCHVGDVCVESETNSLRCGALSPAQIRRGIPNGKWRIHVRAEVFALSGIRVYGVLLETTASPKCSHRLKHHARIDAPKPEGVAEGVAERLFAWLVWHHIDVASRIWGFKI
jgi:hypothetical protein